jgi:hypothetical protein
MNHTAELHGYFTGSEMIAGGRNYEGVIVIQASTAIGVTLLRV